MYMPYLAILWNPLDAAQANASADFTGCLHGTSWLPILQHNGMFVYTQHCSVPYLEAQVLRDGNGVILGVVFERARNCRVSPREIHADARLTDPTPETPRHLRMHYWGAYIALLANRNGQWWVMRDPSGMLPCYYTTAHGITLISSDARNFRFFDSQLGRRRPLISLEVNWRYLAAFLAQSQLQIRETSLKNIYELLAGETLYGAEEHPVVEITWNPATLARPDRWESLRDRCNALHETAQSCINAWAGIHEWIVHSLSGGFDSSLVLALLTRSPSQPNVVCVHRYATGPGEDERLYARLAANAAGTPLIEWPWNFGHHAFDEFSLDILFGAKPSVNALVSPLERPFFEALRDAHPVDAIWSGEGGDHLFMAMRSEWSLVDYLETHALRGGLLNTLHDTARLTGRSIPALASLAIRHWFGSVPDDSDAKVPEASFLALDSPHRHDLPRYIQHPWSASTSDLPPGKRHQILLLAEVLHRLRPLPETQQTMELQPLLSQPLMEQCLRIPTYELLYRGRTRGLARSVFAAEIPQEILNRELKGNTTHHALELLHRSLPFLSEFLQHGLLAEQSLIDPLALEPLVTGRVPITGPQILPLFACIAAEAWTRTWLDSDCSRHSILPAPAPTSRSTSP